MKNKFTLLELNQRNEIRADINLAFKKRLPLKCNRKIRLAGYCHMAAIRQAVYLLLPFSFQKSIS